MPKVKVGNYSAPVDTTGMDPEMKDTFKPIGPRNPPPAPNPFSGIANAVARGIKNLTGNNRSPSTLRDVGHASGGMSQAQEDSLSKKYLGK